jgi:aminopeptidase N
MVMMLSSQTAKVYIKQTQAGDKLFKLPIPVDIYNGARKKSYNGLGREQSGHFLFSCILKTGPDQCGDKILLAEKKDAKTLPEYIHQYTYAGKYLDRREAVDFANKNLGDPAAYQLVTKALSDPFFRIRSLALTGFSSASSAKLEPAVISKIEFIAKNDENRPVRAAAIDALAKLKNNSYKDFFTRATRDSSYSVAGAALEALAALDGNEAYRVANGLAKDVNKGRLLSAITNVTIKYGDETAFDFVTDKFEKMPLSIAKVNMITSYTDFLVKVTNPANFKKGVDMVLKVRDDVPSQARAQFDPMINKLLNTLADKKDAAGAKDLADYIRSKVPAEKK